MTMAKRQQLARELDTCVRYLRLTGLDDTALVAAMSVHMAGFQAIMNVARPDCMGGLAGRLPDLRHYAALVTSMAADTRDRTIKVPE